VIAAFAAARLAADPAEEAAARLAHAQHYAARAEVLNDANLSDDPAEHLDDLAFLAQMDFDFSQISRAVAWAQDNPVAWPALRVLIGSCRNYALGFRSLIAEYQAWSQAALRIAEAIQDRLGAANARLALGDLALRQDDLAGAGEQYRAALADFQAIGDRLGAANVLKAQGDVALRAGDVESGMALLDQARQIYSLIGERVGLSNVGITLARHAASRGDWASAIRYMQPAADFGKAIGHPLGEQLQQQIEEWRSRLQEQQQAAARLLQQWEPVIAATVAAAQGDAEAAGQLAPLFDQLGATADWRNLIAALRRVLAGERAFSALAEGLDATDRLILGTILRRLCAATADWPGAAAAAEALIALGAADAETWAALAEARANQGDGAGASEAYEQAVALAPDGAMLRRNYANVLIALGRLDEAAAQLDAAEQLEPDAPYLALRRAELAKARGDRAEAARWAQEALRRRPGWEEAAALLAWGNRS